MLSLLSYLNCSFSYDGKHKISVVINPANSNKKLKEIQSTSGGVSFTQLLISFAASSALFSTDVIQNNSGQLENAIRERLIAGLLEDVTLGELAGKTFQTNEFIVVFN